MARKADVDAAAEEFKLWAERQTKRNAEAAAEKFAAGRSAALAALWRIRLAVAEETAAVGAAEDDEAQVEQRRHQRLQALKSQWLRTTAELRGLRYATDEQNWPDEALPAALVDVDLLPDDKGMDDLLKARPRRKPSAFFDSRAAEARAMDALAA